MYMVSQKSCDPKWVKIHKRSYEFWEAVQQHLKTLDSHYYHNCYYHYILLLSLRNVINIPYYFYY
jgi:hypothetical protein